MFTCNFFFLVLTQLKLAYRWNILVVLFCAVRLVYKVLFISPIPFFFSLLYLHAPCCCRFFECHFALWLCSCCLSPSPPLSLSLLCLSSCLFPPSLSLSFFLSPSPPRVSLCNVALAASQLLRLKACASFFSYFKWWFCFRSLVSWRTVQLAGCLFEELVSVVAPLHRSL